jgi:hypothetical protein
LARFSRWQARQEFSWIKAESEYRAAEFLTKPVDLDQLKFRSTNYPTLHLNNQIRLERRKTIRDRLIRHGERPYRIAPAVRGAEIQLQGPSLCGRSPWRVGRLVGDVPQTVTGPLHWDKDDFVRREYLFSIWKNGTYTEM